MSRCFLFLLLFYCGSPSGFLAPVYAVEPSPPDFNRAAELSQKGEGAQALALWQQLLSLNPQDPALLTNAGIAAAQSQQWGLALSYLRDAVHLAPHTEQTQQALEYVQARLPVKEIPHNVELWESYRSSVLGGLSLIPLLLVGALVTLLVGLLFLRWLDDRRLADENDEPLPPFRAIHLISLVLFLAFSGLILSKVYEGLETRATILPEKVAVHSAADAEAPSLFDLYAGLEVWVLRHDGDWVQIQYPGGPTGWLKEDSLRISTVSPF